MLRIHPICIEVTRQVRPLSDRIAQFDGAQAKQLRESVCSVAFNVGEGSGLRAGRRRNAYDIALGEARETLTNLQVAEAIGYIPPLEPRLLNQLNQIIGTLVRILHHARPTA